MTSPTRTTATFSADEALGITINQLMFTRRVTRKALGAALGITGPAMGKKLRGENGWTLEDLYTVARYFDISFEDLLPRPVADLETHETPSTEVEGASLKKLVAGAGFEPTTSGL